MKYPLLLVSIIFLATACNKKTSAGKEVEIYLLKSYQRVSGKCQVDAATAVLEAYPIISNSDIVAWSKTEYWFELTSGGMQRVKITSGSSAYAITVDKQVIYYAIFKPFISSSSCEHSITMNYDLPGGNKLSFILGYPGGLPGAGIDDQRNNSQLIATLSAQGKLR